MYGLQSLRSMPFDGLLKRSMTGLGNLGLNSVDCICNKDHVYVSISFITFFHGSLHKLYAHFCMLIGLMVVL